MRHFLLIPVDTFIYRRPLRLPLGYFRLPLEVPNNLVEFALFP